jgi:hypothetical protein
MTIHVSRQHEPEFGEAAPISASPQVPVATTGLDGGDGAGPVGHGTLGDSGVWGEALEAVRDAGVRVELDGHAGAGERRGVGDAFVSENVEIADLDVCGCESGEVGKTGRCGDGRDGVGTDVSPRRACQPV